MARRCVDGNISTTGADRHDQLDLVVEVLRQRRVGHIGAARHHGIRGLGKEERRLTLGVMAHLAGMLGIVAANAIDAAHRELSASLDRHDDGGRRGKNEIGHDTLGANVPGL